MQLRATCALTNNAVMLLCCYVVPLLVRESPHFSNIGVAQQYSITTVQYHNSSSKSLQYYQCNSGQLTQHTKMQQLSYDGAYPCPKTSLLHWWLQIGSVVLQYILGRARERYKTSTERGGIGARGTTIAILLLI